MTNTSNTSSTPSTPAAADDCIHCAELLSTCCAECGAELGMSGDVLLLITSSVEISDFDSLLDGPPAVAVACRLSHAVRVGFDPVNMRSTLIFILDSGPDATLAATAPLACRIEEQFASLSAGRIEKVERCYGYADDYLLELWLVAKQEAEQYGDEDRFTAAILAVPTRSSRVEREPSGRDRIVSPAAATEAVYLPKR